MKRFREGMQRLYVSPEWQGPLKNPNKGWAVFPINQKAYTLPEGDVFEGYDEIVYNSASLGYTRFNWVNLNSEKGIYDFSRIDKFIECAQKHGWKVGFGAPTAAASTTNKLSLLPDYMYQEGMQYLETKVENNHTFEQYMQRYPVWNDPVYLKYCKEFVNELARKYDGDPRIAFINPGTYGNWGEWHTQFLGDSKALTFEQAKEHVKIWAEAFKKTTLILPINHHMPERIAQWACDNYGFGMSRWGLIYLPDDHYSASYCLNKAPAIGEFYTNYERTKLWGSWSREKFTELIEGGHMTWLELGHGKDANEIYKEERELLDTLQNRIGYHIVVKSAAEYFESNEENEVEFGMIIENKGVAPIYFDCKLVVALLDEKNNVIEKHITDINTRNWYGNSFSSFRFSAPFKDKEGKVVVGLFTDVNLDKPDVMFANQQLIDNWLLLR